MRLACLRRLHAWPRRHSACERLTDCVPCDQSRDGDEACVPSCDRDCRNGNRGTEHGIGMAHAQAKTAILRGKPGSIVPSGSRTPRFPPASNAGPMRLSIGQFTACASSLCVPPRSRTAVTTWGRRRKALRPNVDGSPTTATANANATTTHSGSSGRTSESLGGPARRASCSTRTGTCHRLRQSVERRRTARAQGGHRHTSTPGWSATSRR